VTAGRTVYSQAQMKSLIEYAAGKNLKVIPFVMLFTHADQMLAQLCTNTVYQPASPTPVQTVMSGSTANPYYSYNGHTYAGIASNITSEVLALFSDLYGTGAINYEYPDYLLAGFDELDNATLQYFIDQCGSTGATVRSKFVETIHATRVMVDNISGGQTKTIVWGDKFLSKKLAEAPYGDTNFLSFHGALNGTADDMYLAVLNDELSKDVVIADWNYGASAVGYPSIRYFSNKGYKTMGTTWYNLDANQCWADFIHANRAALTNVIGMQAVSCSDNNRYVYYRADRFEAMVPTAASLFLEIGSVAGVQTIPAKPVLRCYVEDNGLYYLNTFFGNWGGDTVCLSAYANDAETPASQLTGSFYVKPHNRQSWSEAQNITATNKTIIDINGDPIALTCHGGYTIPSNAVTGPWDIQFVYCDNDANGDIPTRKVNYLVREDAFIVNATGVNDFTRKACIASYNFNLPSATVPNYLAGSAAPDGTIIGNDFWLDDTLYSYNVAAKSFNASGYDTYVSVPNDSIFDCFADGYTLEFWYKETRDPSTIVGSIVGKGDAYWGGFDVRTTDASYNGKLYWVVAYSNYDDGTHRIYLRSNTALTDNQWYHIAVTAEDIQNGDQIDTKACIYINGQLDATITKTNSRGMSATTSPLRMMGGAGYYASGALADVKIYDSVLTAEDLNSGVVRLNLDGDAPAAHYVTADHSPFFNLGNCTNIAFVAPGADGTGKCAYFNGSNSYVNLPAYENMQIDDSFYIKFKIKIEAQPTSYQVLVENGLSYGSGFEIWTLLSHFYIRLWTYIDDASGEVSTANAFGSTAAIPIGQWTDIVLSFDSTAKQLKFYVGGVLSDTKNTPTGRRMKAGNITLGKSNISGAMYFKGYMDEIIVENKVYTP